MRNVTFIFLAAFCVASSARADDGRDLSLTIYPGNFALVEDQRAIDFVAGRSVIGFPDVSANIRPETASLSAEGVTVVEQNFDFDLLTPQKLMEKALGQTVKIVRTNPGTGVQSEEEATVLSTQQGVVLKVGGRIEVLRDDGVPTRVIFDKVPENLRARPTLSILVASNHGGRRPATLSYMTTGLGWKADYVASFDEKAQTLDLQGWVTLTNSTGVAYDNARVKVASGAVGSGGMASQPNYGRRDDVAANASPNLFDLPEAVTVTDRQAKQVGMVSLKGVRAEKVYRSVWRAGQGSNYFSGSGQTAKADVVLRFEASDGGGTGWRLPQGALRAFLRDAKGEAQFVGEAQIPDVAAGGKVETTISRAFDIDVTPRLVSSEKFGETGRREAVEYKLANASNAEVAVEIEQGGLSSDARVINESSSGVALDAFRRQWTVKVPAHGQVLLTAVLEQGK